MGRKLRISFYFRKPAPGAHSIEGLFRNVEKHLSDRIECTEVVARYPSKGLFPRIINMIGAIFRQGDLNHITGDIHYVATLLNKTRTILTIHDCGILERSKGIKRLLIYIIWYWIPVKRVTRVTTVSEFSKREILKYVRCKPEKIKVIGCCISGHFKYSPYTFNEDCPTILLVGAKANKNLARTVSALQDTKCRIVIVGKVDQSVIRQLEQTTADYRCIHGLSEQEMFRTYKDSDMLVFASTYEGFGMPIIEANAVGRPVITSMLSSMPEVAGNAACLVDPYNISSIREGINKLINDQSYRERLISAGLDNSNRFRAESIAKQYEVIYEEIYNNTSFVKECN